MAEPWHEGALAPTRGNLGWADARVGAGQSADEQEHSL